MTYPFELNITYQNPHKFKSKHGIWNIHYSQFFENVDKDFVLHVLFVCQLGHGPLDSSWRDSVVWKHGRPETALSLLLLDKNRLTHNELFDIFCCHKLGVAIVNNFVNYLIYEHKILPYALLVEHSTIISEHFHHSVKDVHHVGGRHIVLGCCYEEYPELLSVKEIDALHALHQSKVHSDN